ncbi:MAG: cation transporter [Bradyrhizobium sp.]|jgi:mercuric ion binding protein|uniref:cation transporter n=1 Tax=unclassified Bradyrhizobium TaxID=2631580 RepID=UPI0007111AF5|nr:MULTISPECIES: cation transporter [unclassified Bradyrhizobium]KQT13744.1 mercuric transport protein periplasmic component [Bradyrhizobium sp. Leaf396]
MKKSLSVLALIASMIPASTALAAERTVTFAVDNMTCASCPYIVKTSMAAVPGVKKVAVSFQAKTATVTFDDAKTSADVIASASVNAGYPAHLRQQGS